MNVTVSNTRRPAEGTVSHGTLRQQDLLRAFASAYEHVLPHNSARMVREAREIADGLDRQERDGVEHPFDAIDMIVDLESALDSIACVHGMYFGTLEGDASDFGFYPFDESELGSWQEDEPGND